MGNGDIGKWISKRKELFDSFDLNCVDVRVFPSSPCHSNSILCAVGPSVRIGIVAPQLPAGSLCYAILLCLKCHLKKESKKY